MRKQTIAYMAALAMAIVGTVAFVGTGFAAKGGIKGPPTGGEVSNDLSFPAALTESVNSIAANWSMPAEPELGVHYSYGCDVPEMDGQFSYPNTSCVDSLSAPTVHYTAEECTDAVAPSPCQGYEVSKIYWQKIDVNEWWADQDGVAPDIMSVAYVDWGDALEAVSWNEGSVIRVETQPFSSTIPGFDPALGSCAEATADPENDCKVGLQMWHVSGQGITEHWGARANEDDVSFNYDSPFQIINTGTARLNLTKMVPGDALCPMPGGNPGEAPPIVGDWTGSEWDGTCTYMDAPFSVELSVGGKYVYGYNWRMRNVTALEDQCGPGWLKTGYWRLTFYTPGAVAFDDPLAHVTAPPAVPAYARELPRTEFNPPMAMLPLADDDGEEEETDALYKPVIDTVNNLTYIDICIVAKTQGGGGGGGGGGGPGGGGGGGGPGGGGGRHVR